METVEGQEEETGTDFEGDTKITPFNMREEMEEGHFDSTGSFVFKKKGDDIKDAWLDNIDWGKVKKDAGDMWGKETEEEEDVKKLSGSEQISVYKDILSFLQPNETITRALRRLGGNQTASDERKQRWEKKKKPADQATNSAVGEESVVGRLTALVDRLVAEGDLEMYGYTYEKLNHELQKKESEQKDTDSRPSMAGGKEAELDMFAEEIDKDRLAEPAIPASTSELIVPSKFEAEAANENTEALRTSSKPASVGTVLWEFKWENKPGVEIFGPCSSEQMSNWADEGYFKEGVWVRKTGNPDATFYSSKRIDFDLYVD